MTDSPLSTDLDAHRVPGATLPALLEARARRSPGAEGLRFEGRSLTFGQIWEHALAMARDLGELGVRRGQRVAVIVHNGLDFPLAWLAIPMLRAVVVPVHAGYRGNDLRHVLEASRASIVLAGAEQLPLLEEIRPGLARVRGTCALADGRIDGVVGGGLPRSEVELASEPAGAGPAEDAVTLQFTSGTSGLPKACILRHGYWLRLARTMQGYLGLGADDVLLTAQPQSYMDPSWNLVLALLVGAPLVVLPRFSASGFWRDVAANRATFFYCIGTMPLYLSSQPADPRADRAHSVRMVYCSGIPTASHAELERRWGCPWRETYGTTELGVVLAVPPPDADSVGTGDLGEPVAGREIRVVDDLGHDVRPGEPGELIVRGPDTMVGYDGDPDATRAWRPDGWARTGDVVVRDAQGRTRLRGRRRDVIRRGGENVSAAEVETTLAEHPAVAAAACIAVPDPLRGEEVKAYVQLAPGAAREGVTPSSLHGWVAERLARFKVPRYIEIVDTFPLTPSEKIAKDALVRSRADHAAGSWDAEAGRSPGTR